MAKIRDFTSGLIHCIGSSLSLAGLVLLIIWAALSGDAYDIVSFSLFGSSLFLLYLFSTLYHWLNLGPKGMSVFRKFDNIMIYIFIASSYTVICLGPLRGPWGWSLFGVIWGLAVLGIILSAIWTKVPKALTNSIYFTMGWLILIGISPLIQVYKNAGLLYSLWLLVISGLIYTISGILYILKIPKNKLFIHFGSHEILHLSILLGSIFEYWFIFKYITIF